MVRDLPALALDAPLKAAVANNLGPFTVSLKAKLARHGDGTALALAAPLTLRAARGATLRVPALAATWRDGVARGSLQASLSGGGLPPVSLAAPSFTFADRKLRAAVSLRSKLDFAILKGIDAVLDGKTPEVATSKQFGCGIQYE